MDIFEQNKIIFNGTERRYLIDSFERRYDMENSVPIKLTIEVKDFDISNWGDLIKEVADYLFDLSECSCERFLNFQPTWSSAKFITKNKIVNSHQLKCGLWINTNNTSTHSFWLLTDLFDFFRINKNKCSLIIRRYPKGEPKEICDYFRNKNKENLSKYLKEIENKTDGSIDTIFKNIEYLNKFLNLHKNSGYNDLLLFDSYESYQIQKANYSQIISEYCVNVKNAAILKNTLNYLSNFFKSNYFE